MLITLGGILLIGLATDAIGRHTRLPRVTLLLLFGCLIGPPVLDLIPQFSEQWFSGVTAFALIMVGFLLAGVAGQQDDPLLFTFLWEIGGAILVGTVLAHFVSPCYGFVLAIGG